MIPRVRIAHLPTPIESMPRLTAALHVHPLLKLISIIVFLLPLTPLIHAMRSIMLEGATPLTVWADVAIVAAWIVTAIVLEVRWFRWH